MAAPWINPPSLTCWPLSSSEAHNLNSPTKTKNPSYNPGSRPKGKPFSRCFEKLAIIRSYVEKDVISPTAVGKAVEIGRGVVDIPAVLSSLLAIGYSGIVAFEYEKDADDPLAGLAESVGYVRGVLAAI